LTLDPVQIRVVPVQLVAIDPVQIRVDPVQLVDLTAS
jgi:hypothetical protein